MMNKFLITPLMQLTFRYILSLLIIITKFIFLILTVYLALTLLYELYALVFTTLEINSLDEISYSNFNKIDKGQRIQPTIIDTNKQEIERLEKLIENLEKSVNDATKKFSLNDKPGSVEDICNKVQRVTIAGITIALLFCVVNVIYIIKDAYK